MSLINTRIQNLRENSNLDKNELRPSRYGALDLFQMQTDQSDGIITDDLKERAANSIGSLLQTPVINYDAGITIGNSRELVIADSENTSEMVTITFATYAWGFTMVPSLFNNNEISMQKDFETKFNKYLYALGATLDSAAVSTLEANKSQVFNDSLYYTVTANTLAATWAQRELLLGDLNPILAANDHFADIAIVGNAGIESMVRKLAQHSLYNDQNKTLEYSDKTFGFTTRLTNGAGIFASLFAVQHGSLGMLARFEREALVGRKTSDGHEWGIDTLPMLGLPVGTYFHESVGDYSAIAGAASADMDRVFKEHYGFAVDFAFLTVHNSDATTIASPIVKATIASEV